MRHVIVTRVSLILAVLFLTAAGLFAWLTTRVDASRRRGPMAEPDGVVLFEQYCGSCHSVSSMRSSLGGVSGSRRDQLERFLLDHGDAPSAVDRRILDELSREIARRPE